MAPIRLGDFAARYGFELVGEDVDIVAFGGVGTRSANATRLLTYVGAEEYLEGFAASEIAACVIGRTIAEKLPSGRSALITPGDAQEAFFTIFADSVDEGRWTAIETKYGAGNEIAETAVVHDGVEIGDDSTIMDNVVILPNTRLGDRVVIKPNATVGGQGFQLAVVRGKRRLVPHAGGVSIGSDVTIGSQTCVDRGLFGEFTSIEDGARIDNLVHIAHSARIGRDATVVACAEVSGSVDVGSGAWLAPSCAINPSLSVGDHAMVGTGSVVVKDIPPHGIAYGVPAKVLAWRCVCGTRLNEEGSGRSASCRNCGRVFSLEGPHPVEVTGRGFES
jgi:UDP-3-O-[3-hydroxymyristoyl] glucosamine N-acyltransferase